MSNPLVSIITLTYNHQQFIERCIESVLAQTYPNWEQIIIDDSSTDNTEKIVRKFSDSRIKYIKQNHVGALNLGITYNKALQISNGELISVLEGDDYWPPYKLEIQIHAFTRKEVILSYGNATIVDSNGDIIKQKYQRARKNQYFRSKLEQLERLLQGNFIVACTVICRKNVLVSIGGFRQPESIPFVDYPTWLELSLLGDFYPFNEILGFYRWHKKQVSTSLMDMVMINASLYRIEFYNQLPQDVKLKLSINKEDLNKAHKCVLSTNQFYKGRIALLNREWTSARDYFSYAIKTGPLKIKIASIFCFLLSFLGIDFEGIARRIGLLFFFR